MRPRFPESPQGQDARFLIAECWYAKQEFHKAENAYLLYIKNYPQGSRMCASLYKLGLLYDSTLQPKSRDLAWDKLLDLCPESPEAATVESRRR